MRLPDKMNASCLRKTCRAVFPPACLCAGLQLTADQPRSRGQRQAFMQQPANGALLRRCCVNPVSASAEPRCSSPQTWVLCRDAAAGLVPSLRPSLVRRSLKPKKSATLEARYVTRSRTAQLCVAGGRTRRRARFLTPVSSRRFHFLLISFPGLSRQKMKVPGGQQAFLRSQFHTSDSFN